MKTAADLASKELANTKGTGLIDRMQRNAYLNSKGIKPTGQFQLDLIFPDTIGDREDLRHIPNDYARSSIFTARNKREPRRTLMREKLFHYSEHVSILYTGIELRAEDDELVGAGLQRNNEIAVDVAEADVAGRNAGSENDPVDAAAVGDAVIAVADSELVGVVPGAARERVRARSA